MKKILVLAFFAIVAAGTVNAQDYKNAIGLRFGDSAGINYKHKMANGNAIDVIVGYSLFETGSLNVAGLYEWYTPLGSNGFSLYYGAGAHLGIFNKNFALGIDGIVGVEYKFPKIPLALSLDYKPGINFIPDVYWGFNMFGLGVKYTF